MIAEKRKVFFSFLSQLPAHELSKFCCFVVGDAPGDWWR